MVVARQEAGQGGAPGAGPPRAARRRRAARGSCGCATWGAWWTASPSASPSRATDGKEAVGLLVFKEAGANTVTVARVRARGRSASSPTSTPPWRWTWRTARPGFIADSISNVVQSLVFGGLLAFLVLFLFLRDPRYPVAIALSIPISVVATFALMEAAGVSLNIMSLGGLALGVGMLVDNSIVVLENIFRHREELGAGPVEAASRGAEEVQGAITASTLTTISVFGPIIYVEGVAGELFKDLSLAVAFSLLASLVVALTLLPSMAARFATVGRRGRAERRPDAGASAQAGRLGHAALGRRRRPCAHRRRAARGTGRLGGALVRFWARRDRFRRWAARSTPCSGASTGPSSASPCGTTPHWSGPSTIRAASWGPPRGSSLLSVALTGVLRRDLLPQVDQGAFQIRLELPEGTALTATAEASHADRGGRSWPTPGVAAVFSNIGRDVRAYAEGEEASGLHTATFQVRVADHARSDDVADRMRALADRFPPGALSVETGQATALGAMLGGAEADIAVRVRSEDLDQAYAMAAEVERRLESVAAVGNVRDRHGARAAPDPDRDRPHRVRCLRRGSHGGGRHGGPYHARRPGHPVRGLRPEDRRGGPLPRGPPLLAGHPADAPRRGRAHPRADPRAGGHGSGGGAPGGSGARGARVRRRGAGRAGRGHRFGAGGAVVAPPLAGRPLGRGRRERGDAPLLPRPGLRVRAGAGPGLHDPGGPVRVLRPSRSRSSCPCRWRWWARWWRSSSPGRA